VKDQALNTKPKKEKTSKAERRALQEAQRAAKAAAKGVYWHLACPCLIEIGATLTLFILGVKEFSARACENVKFLYKVKK